MQNNQTEDEILLIVRRLLDAEGIDANPSSATASSMSAAALPQFNLDAWERRIRDELTRSENQAKSTGWQFWRRRVRASPWLKLCSGSGFERESALRALLDAAPNGFLYALALRRLNDWVPQVRAAARAQLPLIAMRSNPVHVVDALWITLPHCNSWGRMEARDRQVLADLIAIERVAHALGERIKQASFGPAALVLAQAGRTPALDSWLGGIARHAIQPTVRAIAYRGQLEGRMVWVVGRKWKWTDKVWGKGRFESVFDERVISVKAPFGEVLEMAAADRSPIVRRVAAELLIKHWVTLGAQSTNLAKQLAADPSSYVAERGRFALERLATEA